MLLYYAPGTLSCQPSAYQTPSMSPERRISSLAGPACLSTLPPPEEEQSDSDVESAEPLMGKGPGPGAEDGGRKVSPIGPQLTPLPIRDPRRSASLFPAVKEGPKGRRYKFARGRSAAVTAHPIPIDGTHGRWEGMQMCQSVDHGHPSGPASLVLPSPFASSARRVRVRGEGPGVGDRSEPAPGFAEAEPRPRKASSISILADKIVWNL